MNLTTYKLKKVAAKKGYDLLKSKADALKVLCVLIIQRIMLILVIDLRN